MQNKEKITQQFLKEHIWGGPDSDSGGPERIGYLQSEGSR